MSAPATLRRRHGLVPLLRRRAEHASGPPATSDGVLSSTELGLVYQLVLQRYVDPVDHAKLIEAAIAAVHEAGVKADALPLDLAPVDLLPSPTANADDDLDRVLARARRHRAEVSVLGGRGSTGSSSARCSAHWKTTTRCSWSRLKSRRMNKTNFTVGIRVTRACARSAAVCHRGVPE